MHNACKAKALPHVYKSILSSLSLCEMAKWSKVISDDGGNELNEIHETSSVYGRMDEQYIGWAKCSRRRLFLRSASHTTRVTLAIFCGEINFLCSARFLNATREDPSTPFMHIHATFATDSQGRQTRLY